MQTRMLYSSESNVTTHRLVDMNLGVATNMRGPGEASGTAAWSPPWTSWPSNIRSILSSCVWSTMRKR